MTTPTPAEQRGLNAVADALAAIGDARDHDYSRTAAFHAAAHRLAALDHAELLAVAGALAAIVATAMRPTAEPDIDRWLAAATFAVAMRP
jgi:hypothetical protein